MPRNRRLRWKMSHVTTSHLLSNLGDRSEPFSVRKISSKELNKPLHADAIPASLRVAAHITSTVQRFLPAGLNSLFHLLKNLHLGIFLRVFHRTFSLYFWTFLFSFSSHRSVLHHIISRENIGNIASQCSCELIGWMFLSCCSKYDT